MNLYTYLEINFQREFTLEYILGTNLRNNPMVKSYYSKMGVRTLGFVMWRGSVDD